MCSPSFLKVLAAAGILASLDAMAAVATVPIVDVVAFQQGYGPSPGDGSVSRLVDGVGLTQTDPDNIATWGHDNLWQHGWQGDGTFPGTQAWVVFDLGTISDALGSLYLWNVNELLPWEGGGGEGTDPYTDRGIQDFKLWYATAPTIAPPATAYTAQTYDFTSGGWTQLGSTHTLAQASAVDGQLYGGVYNLNGIPEARYLAIEVVNNYGSAVRTGLAEAVITAIPEPASYAALVGLALFGFAVYRRTRSCKTDGGS
jgi:hypothetical protein